MEALVSKSVKAALREGARTLGVAGGVAANSLLRRRLREKGEAAGLHVVVPPFAYCTDNAAMIGAAALAGPSLPYPDYLDVDASASLPLGRWSTATDPPPLGQGTDSRSRGRPDGWVSRGLPALQVGTLPRCLTNRGSAHNICAAWHSAVESANSARTGLNCLLEAQKK